MDNVGCDSVARIRLIPGVYAYGSSPAFPTGTWHQTNYWVDVVFNSTSTPAPPSTSTYTISGTAGVSGATLTLSGAASRSTTAGSTGSYSFSSLPNGTYVVAPSLSGYTFTPSTVSVSINGTSKTGVNFTAAAVPNPIPHTVSLSWKASTSTNLKGYYVYRASVAGGAYSKLNASPVASTTFSDTSVSSGRTYYYVTTAVDTSNTESTYSNQATAVIPNP